ncbi:hypothetical protein [Shimazuella soli]|uniref:hypothetical protein n=1 Tax=Shimazuella soli TaxID=1892854 RepID=UPI001F1097AA|nr:hypothetical protein [Shimazuella soli]
MGDKTIYKKTVTEIRERFGDDLHNFKTIFLFRSLSTILLIMSNLIGSYIWKKYYFGYHHTAFLVSLLIWGLIQKYVDVYIIRDKKQYRERIKGTLFKRIVYPTALCLIILSCIYPTYKENKKISDAIHDFGYSVDQPYYFPFTVKIAEGYMDYDTDSLHLEYSVDSFQLPIVDVMISRKKAKWEKGEKIFLKNGSYAVIRYEEDMKDPILVWYAKGLRYELELLQDPTPFSKQEAIKVANSFR